jgi:Holliday junction resolvase RusA-like endonuclease
VLDSIQGNGQVIADDKTVVEVITRKFWGQVDKISIKVEAVK